MLVVGDGGHSAHSADGHAPDHFQEPGFFSLVIPHVTFSAKSLDAETAAGTLTPRKTIGAPARRRRPYRPDSIVNLACPSEDNMSAPLANALGRAAAMAGCLHTSSGRFRASFDRQGGPLILQLGPEYHGCRGRDGRFSLAQLIELVDVTPGIRAIEIAFPGSGAAHSAFDDPDSLLDLLELMASTTGLPVGIKSTVGDLGFWRHLSRLMDTTSRSVDFITIVGQEGLVGGDASSTGQTRLPFALGFSRVQHVFAARQQHDRITFIGEGRLGRPETALLAFSLGCDMVSVGHQALGVQAGCGREAGWLTRGFGLSSRIPERRVARLAAEVAALREHVMALARNCGASHPSEVEAAQIEVLEGWWRARPASDFFGGRGIGVAAADFERHTPEQPPGAVALTFRRR